MEIAVRINLTELTCWIGQIKLRNSMATTVSRHYSSTNLDNYRPQTVDKENQHIHSNVIEGMYRGSVY